MTGAGRLVFSLNSQTDSVRGIANGCEPYRVRNVVVGHHAKQLLGQPVGCVSQPHARCIADGGCLCFVAAHSGSGIDWSLASVGVLSAWCARFFGS
jgi:hypothetical protein